MPSSSSWRLLFSRSLWFRLDLMFRCPRSLPQLSRVTERRTLLHEAEQWVFRLLVQVQSAKLRLARAFRALVTVGVPSPVHPRTGVLALEIVEQAVAGSEDEDQLVSLAEVVDL